jgi:hypothetical protein
MTQAQAEQFRWNPFDLTKVWPHGEFPLIEVGQLELNRNPENYHAEVEQAAFKPSALVPGIGASPDKMLQARLMSYADTHLHRVGVNHHQIPVNKPRCPVMHYMRDGQGATAETYGARPTTGPTPASAAHAQAPMRASSTPPGISPQTIVDRFDSTQDHDDYTQPGNLYRLFDDAHRDRLATRIAGVLGQARKEVQMLQLCHFFRADEDYGRRVAEKLGLSPADVFVPQVRIGRDERLHHLAAARIVGDHDLDPLRSQPVLPAAERAVLADNDAADPVQHHSAGAHRAWAEGGGQGEVAPVAPATGVPQADRLGMSGRVACLHPQVVPDGKHDPGARGAQGSADRDAPLRPRLHRLGDGGLEEDGPGIGPLHGSSPVGRPHGSGVVQ